jgi:hypothetical protein
LPATHRPTTPNQHQIIIIMPTPSGNSGTNSQGNHYSTPGGTNSNPSGSYHCKCKDDFCLFVKQPFSFLTVILVSRAQTPTTMDRTTTRTTMDLRIITLETEHPTTPLPAADPLAKSKGSQFWGMQDQVVLEVPTSAISQENAKPECDSQETIESCPSSSVL